MQPPQYVALQGSSTYPPPVRANGCDARVFLLEAKPDQAINEWLNVPINSVFDYVALPMVALVTMSIQKVRSMNTQGEWEGWAAENDVGFAVPIAAFRNDVLDHFAVAFPFIMVDNPLTLTTG